jgi:hypothetical protein
MIVRVTGDYRREAVVPLEFTVVQEAARRNHYRPPFLLLDPELGRSNVRADAKKGSWCYVAFADAPVQWNEH